MCDFYEMAEEEEGFDTAFSHDIFFKAASFGGTDQSSIVLSISLQIPNFLTKLSDEAGDQELFQWKVI